MSSLTTYNLSAIPGVIELFQTEEVKPEYEKYYSVKQYSTKANEDFSILRYKKDFLSVDLLSTYGLLRSVILSNNRIVCFSPPKSLSGEQFMKNYPTKTPNLVAEEFVEGTMINVFYNGSWQISTRNTVGAEVKFYQSATKSFYQLFCEACSFNNFNIQTLNPDFCYSFVLQHPDNRIVVPFNSPQLFLIAVYQIDQHPDSIRIIEQNLNTVKTYGLWHTTGVKFPEIYEFTTYTELIERFASPNTPYDVLGVVVKNIETGERTKFRNPIYEEVRHLRGNQPKLQYQYLSLRHSGKLPEFLKFYPETKVEMSKFRDQVHMFTNTLHQNYISCYVRKEKPLREYSDQYRTHMFKLHEQFINDLRPNNLSVTNTVVIKYVNSLHPSLLMYCLNHNMRKRMVDNIRVSADV